MVVNEILKKATLSILVFYVSTDDKPAMEDSETYLS